MKSKIEKKKSWTGAPFGKFTNTDRSKYANTEYNQMYKNTNDDKIGEKTQKSKRRKAGGELRWQKYKYR